MGFHSSIPYSFNSLEEAIAEVVTLKPEESIVFLNCLAKEYERQAVYDEFKGFFKIAREGFSIANTVLELLDEPARLPDNDFVRIRFLAHEISFLRYDASRKVISDMILSNSYTFFEKGLRKVYEALDNLWKLSAKHMGFEYKEGELI